MIEKSEPSEPAGYGFTVEEIARTPSGSKSKGEDHTQFTKTHRGMVAVRMMASRWDVSFEEAEARYNQVVTDAYEQYVKNCRAESSTPVGFNPWFDAQMMSEPENSEELRDEVKAIVFQISQEQWALEHQGLYSPMD